MSPISESSSSCSPGTQAGSYWFVSELSQPSFAYESAPIALKLLPASFWFFENCCSTLAISSPVSKIRERPSVRPQFVSTACCLPLLEMPGVFCSHHQALLRRKYFRLFRESRGKFNLLAGRLLDFQRGLFQRRNGRLAHRFDRPGGLPHQFIRHGRNRLVVRLRQRRGLCSGVDKIVTVIVAGIEP